MFGALRRCPASLSRNVPTAIRSSNTLRIALPRPSNAIRILGPRVSHISASAFHYSAKLRENASVQERADQDTEASQQEPITEFKDLATQGLVHPNLIDTITRRMKLQTMTEVQSRTINEALSGGDVIAQAKTGTGKTLGFLIPIIQRIIEQNPQLGERTRGYKRARPDDIKAIVISPTRELAEQIAVEAQKVVAGTGIVVQTAVGGTQKRAMLQRTQREGCHLLIGTPGRLNDIFSDPTSGVRAPKLNALVMDEADRLLDGGFHDEIEAIKSCLPDPEEVDRQTLMFSATVPREVVSLVRNTLKPGFHFARCVDENEEPTHHRVPQKVVHVNGFENIMPTFYELVLRETEAARNSGRPFKAIVYFNSTAEVTLAASVFFKLTGGFRRESQLHGLNAFEIHSKLTQAQRTRSSDSFRASKSAILFSSDVTARGMDFPNVTHVIQVGLPKDRESYIHRIGRTGRAGKEGEGLIFITPLEANELRRRLHKLPLKEDGSLEAASVDMTTETEMPENVSKIIQQTLQAYKKVYPDQLDAAYRGLFGSFAWINNKHDLLDAAQRMAEFGWGMDEAPQPPSSFFANGGRRSGGHRSGGGRDGFGRRGGFGGRGGPGGRGGFSDRGRSGGFSDRHRGDADRYSERPGRGSFGGDRRGRSGFADRGRASRPEYDF